MNTLPDFTVYEGIVFHGRLRPKKHSFRYSVFSFLVDLDALDSVAQRHRFFSRNKFNLFSFHDRDHGTGQSEDIARYLRVALADAGLPLAEKIYALFYPRIFGYAFNPLVVFYCYDDAGRMVATFYQVNNTFGERHTYLLAAPRSVSAKAQNVDKVFHVSPFIDMTMRYEFKAPAPSGKISLAIDVSDDDGILLKTSFRGEKSVFSDGALLRLLLSYPLMVVKVFAGIHIEALKLLLKGLRLRAGGPAPASSISVVANSRLEGF